MPKVSIRGEFLHSDNVFSLKVEGYKNERRLFHAWISLSLSSDDISNILSGNLSVDAPTLTSFELPLHGYFDFVLFHFEEHQVYKTVKLPLDSCYDDMEIGIRFVEKRAPGDSPSYAGGREVYAHMHPNIEASYVPYNSIKNAKVIDITYMK